MSSCLPNDENKGLNRPPNAKIVRTTAMWASTLFSFFRPLVKNIKTIPIKTGIRAVTDGVSDEKYPHEPKLM